MNQPSSFEPHLHIESPYRHLKHVERFETEVFPTCHTVQKEWKLGRRLINQQRNIVLIHHNPGCRWSVARIYEEGRQLKFESLDDPNTQ